MKKRFFYLKQLFLFIIFITRINAQGVVLQNSLIEIDLQDVKFISATVGWAVGEDGTIIKTTDGGATWSEQTSPTVQNLEGVSFTDSNNGTAVGWWGTIIKTTNGGTTWTFQTSGTEEELYAVSFADANNGIVVGWFGTILRTTNGGATWTDQSGIGNALYDVSFIDSNIGTIVGNSGTILRTTSGGIAWTAQNGITTKDLYAVSFTDVNNGTAVGMHGTTVRTTNGGADWAAQSFGEKEDLFGVSFTDANTGTAVGATGTILRTTNGGTTWTAQSSGTSNTLNSVSFTDANNGTAVGDSGTILRTTNGGTTWTAQSSGTTNTAPTASFTVSQKSMDALTTYEFNASGSSDNEDATSALQVRWDWTNDGSYDTNYSTWKYETHTYDLAGTYTAKLEVKDSGGLTNTTTETFIAGYSEFSLQFSSLADMNNARFGAGYTFDGNYIYSVSGGIGESPWTSTSIEGYDITNDTWTEFATGLIPRRYCSAEYVSSQNKIYIFNGYAYTGSPYTNTIEIVSPGLSSISYTTSNPYPVEYGGSAVWNDKIYVFGGSNSDGYSNRLYEFDPQSDTWTRLTDMEEAKQTSGRIIDGVLYVFGGYNGSVSKRIDAYNIQTSSWTRLGDMPVGISAHSTAIHCKYIWLVGSYDNLQSLAVYDAETNIFTQLSSDMVGRRHSGAVVARDILYVFGGNQASSYSSALKSLEYTDLSQYCITNAIEDIMIPVDFQLNQNYPNPFNPTTTIHYTLSEESDITITIFDMLGRKVNQVISSVQPAGSHTIQWNGTDHNGNPVSTGIYVYQIQAGDFVQTKKMVLMK